METFDVSEVRRGLLVFVPGIRTRRRERGPQRYSELIERLAVTLGDAWRVEVYRHGQSASSREDLDEVVGDLAASIRQWAGEVADDVEPPDAIILVGHSFGGVLARAAFVQDAGGGRGRTVQGYRPWTTKVRRIVLLGSPNSGYRWNAAGVPFTWRMVYALATPFADFAVEKVRTGGYWITNLRLKWLDTFRRLADPPRVVQVLGGRDDLVSRQDILDARFMPNTIEVDIPGATHAGLVNLATAEDPDERYAQLRTTILGRRDEAAPTPLPPVEGPTYFVLHGIRASAYENWVQDLSDQLMRQPGNERARIIRPDTGYFSAVEFALPGTRKRKIHQFLKLYGDAYATGDPNAFRFAGHSNGTYMMARSLDRVPAMRFERIFLAGTVLPRDFAWQDIVDRRQVGSYGSETWSVGQVRNDRATRDVPVGILCSWLRGLGSGDVGTAGLNGFEMAPSGLVDGARAFEGGHGAALMKPEQLTGIAGYLSGRESALPPAGAPTRAFRWLSRFVGNRLVAWFLLLVLVALLGLAVWGLWVWLGGWWAVGIAVGVVLLIWVLLRTI